MEELRATPDGRYFVFSGHRDGKSHLYRINHDGSGLRQLTFGESFEVDSTVSPDSRWVYYVSNRRDGNGWRSDLKKTPIDGGEAALVYELESSTFAPHLAPDGKTISGIVGETLQLQKLDGSITYRIAEKTEYEQRLIIKIMVIW